jgi:HAMP domain-containing protein
MSPGLIYGLFGSACTVLLGVIGFWARRWITGTDSSIEDVEQNVKRLRRDAKNAREEMEETITQNAVAREQKMRDDLDEHIDKADEIYARKPRLNRFEERMNRKLRSIDDKLERIIEMHLDP